MGATAHYNRRDIAPTKGVPTRNQTTTKNAIQSTSFRTVTTRHALGVPLSLLISIPSDDCRRAAENKWLWPNFASFIFTACHFESVYG